MGRRKLTPDEIDAYRDMAEAAAKLRDAQRKAEAECQAAGKKKPSVNLSITPPAPPKGGDE